MLIIIGIDDATFTQTTLACTLKPVPPAQIYNIYIYPDFDEDDSSSDRSHSVSHSRNSSPHPPSIKKRKKAQRTSSGGTLRVHELKAEARRSKREKEEGGKKNVKKKVGL